MLGFYLLCILRSVFAFRVDSALLMGFIIAICCCSVKIAAGAVVCVESEVRGDVTIGENFSFPHKHHFHTFTCERRP